MCAKFRVRRAAVVTEQRTLQLTEQLCFAAVAEFLLQTRQNLIEKRRDPTTFIKFGRVKVIDGFQEVAFLRRGSVERNHFSASAAFEAPRLVPFISEKVCE